MGEGPDQAKRPRGRPRTGRDPTLSLRLPEAVLRQLDELAAVRGLGRSQMARELIIIALLGGAGAERGD